MSWFWAVGIALLVSGVVAAFVVGSRPYVHKNVTAERFSRLLDTLYDTMTDGSILVIRHDCSEAFLQFVKRASPVGDVLGFGFPDADWSRTHWSPLLRCLQENSVEYSVAETGDGAVPRFVSRVLAAEHSKSALHHFAIGRGGGYLEPFCKAKSGRGLPP